MESHEYENKVVDKLYQDFCEYSDLYFDISAQMRVFHNGIKLAIRIDGFDWCQKFLYTYSVIVDPQSVKPKFKPTENFHLTEQLGDFIDDLRDYEWKSLLNLGSESVDYEFILDMPAYANKIKMYKIKPYIGNSYIFCYQHNRPAWYFITRETAKTYQGCVFIEGEETKFKASKSAILENIEYPFIIARRENPQALACGMRASLTCGRQRSCQHSS